MKQFFILLAITAFIQTSCSAQRGYWQQHAKYKMDIDMDAKNHQFKGEQELIYTNNSPDTLNNVFYHLYYNAFQPGSMMDVRSRTIVDPDPRVDDRIVHLKPNEIGYHKINSLTQNGKALDYEVVGTILEVKLAEPILPGKKATFKMGFDSQVPVQIRRTGRNNQEGVDYSMTQWYPKMCEYDKDGWHANPYIGREFHGIWGDFDVKITIDKNYLLGGTGYVQNPQEVGKGYEDKNKALKTQKGNSDKLTWHFYAPQVHDFAWAADPEFTHDTTVLDNGTILHFIYMKDTLEDRWTKLKPEAKKSFEFVNKHFGEYPYKQYSVIQGGDGGMEYPMCTLITAHSSFQGLVSVTVHESIHSWFQGLMATNESKYAWMDEGFTTFAQYKTMDYLKNGGAINPLARQYGGYQRVVDANRQEPLTTHSDFYKSNAVYGNNAYSKGAILLMQLSYIVGDDAVMRGMKRYYDEWHFKHPTPQDFKRIMEKESNIELDWYFEQFVETTNTIDYSIESVSKSDDKTSIILSKKGDMPMPIDIVVKLKDGSLKWYYIPMRIMRNNKAEDIYEIPRENKKAWPWVYPEYELIIDAKMDDIEAIEIDPSTRMADIDRSDNSYPRKKQKGKSKKESLRFKSN